MQVRHTIDFPAGKQPFLPVELIKGISTNPQKPQAQTPGAKIIMEVDNCRKLLAPQQGKYFTDLFINRPDFVEVGISLKHPRKGGLGEEMYLCAKLLLQTTNDGGCKHNISYRGKTNDENFWNGSSQVGLFCAKISWTFGIQR